MHKQAVRVVGTRDSDDSSVIFIPIAERRRLALERLSLRLELARVCRYLSSVPVDHINEY